MTHRHLVLVAAVILSALLASTASARPAANPTLVGKVGLHDAYTITLTFANGRKVKTLPAGTYRLVVHDYSKIHNFALGSQTQNRRLLTTGIPSGRDQEVHAAPRRGGVRVRLLRALPDDERDVRRHTEDLVDLPCPKPAALARMPPCGSS